MRKQADKAFCFRPSIDALETLELALLVFEVAPSAALKQLIESPEVWEIVSRYAECGRFLQAFARLPAEADEPTG